MKRRLLAKRQALSKLRRVMPTVEVQYVSATSIGLFEQTAAEYGQIWYDLGGRKTMSRMTTAEGVLETIYSLAGVAPPSEHDQTLFRGHPLAVPPKGAAVVFCAVWPALVVIMAVIVRRRLVRSEKSNEREPAFQCGLSTGTTCRPWRR